MTDPSSTFGPYEVVSSLGRGGMGEVFVALRRGPGGFAREVVVKRIVSHLASEPNFVQMFQEEASVLARLNHSNIAQIYDFGEIDGAYYLAMEYVRGVALHRLVKAVHPDGLAVEHAARIASEVAKGLHHAHRATDAGGRPLGLIHRDVTLANIMVSFDGEVKLIDFGIARSKTRTTHTVAGVVKGTPGYMSPEQCRGRPLDARSDVFVLGIVLWEMLARQRLFARPSLMDAMEAIIEAPAAPPSRLRPEVPPDLDEVVLHALEKDPSVRCASAGALSQALDRFLTKHRLLSNAQMLSALVRTHFELAPAGDVFAAARPTAEAAEDVIEYLGSPETDPHGEAPYPASSISLALAPTARVRQPAPLPGAPLPSTVMVVSPDDGSQGSRDEEAASVHGKVTAVLGSPAKPEAAVASPAPTFGLGPQSTTPVLTGPIRHRSLGTRGATAGAAIVAAIVTIAGAAVLIDRHFGGPSEPVAVSLGVPASADGSSSPVVRDSGEDAVRLGAAQAPPSPDAAGPPDAAPDAGGDRRSERHDEASSTRPPPLTPRPEGRVTIDSRPWSVVSIRGRRLGETPVIDVTLPVGVHTVELTDQRGRHHRRTLRVEAGRLTRVRYDLADEAPGP